MTLQEVKFWRNVMAIFYVAMLVIETFHPLGDVVEENFGFFGWFIGQALGVAGFLSVMWAGAEWTEKIDKKYNLNLFEEEEE